MSEVVKQFSFNSTLENWAFTAVGVAVGTRDTSEDSPNDSNAGTGVLQIRTAGKNQNSAGTYWEWGNGVLTWESLGVPTGATITAVNLNYDWKCSEFATGKTNSTGPAELRNSTGTGVTGTFSAALDFSATTSWATRTGTAITGLSDPSNTAIRLRITADSSTGNSSSGAVTLRQDWVVVTITYTASGQSYSITGAITVGATIAATLIHNIHPAITGAISVVPTVSSGLVYNRHAAIPGDVTVTPAVAAGMAYNIHPQITGAVSVACTVAAGLAYNRHYLLDGAVTVAPAISAALDYIRNASITGDVTVGTTVTASLAYNRNASLVGAIPVGINVASGMLHQPGSGDYLIVGNITITPAVAALFDYIRNSNIIGAITLDSAINGAPTYNRNASVVGDVAVACTPSSTLAYNTHPQVSGDLTLDLVVASGMAYAAGSASYSINGTVDVAILIGALSTYTRNASVVGSITLMPSIAAGLTYSAHIAVYPASRIRTIEHVPRTFNVLTDERTSAVPSKGRHAESV